MPIQRVTLFTSRIVTENEWKFSASTSFQYVWRQDKLVDLIHNNHIEHNVLWVSKNKRQIEIIR